MRNQMTIALNPSTYAYPYVILLVFCLLVLGLVLWKYPSLRVYRRKRNILVYVGLALVFSLIALQVYNVSLGPNYIAFGIEKTPNPIYSEQENKFSVLCWSDGASEASFYMVLKSANATLQAKGEMGYIQANDTAIKIPFNFQGSGKLAKPVYFTADANVSSLKFYPFIERQGDSKIIVTTYLSEIQCVWDPTTNSYAMADSSPVPVP
jgi:hypothetical protein